MAGFYIHDIESSGSNTRQSESFYCYYRLYKLKTLLSPFTKNRGSLSMCVHYMFWPYRPIFRCIHKYIWNLKTLIKIMHIHLLAKTCRLQPCTFDRWTLCICFCFSDLSLTHSDVCKIRISKSKIRKTKQIHRVHLSKVQGCNPHVFANKWICIILTKVF
jgi:hypothetical protein